MPRPATSRKINYKVKSLLAQKRLAGIRGKIGRATAVAAMRRAAPMAVAALGGRSGRNVGTRGFLDMELKYYDFAKAGTTIPSTTDATTGVLDPTANAIATPAQGDGPSNRDGKKIVVKSLELNGYIQVSSLANQTAMPEAARIMLAVVLDTQTNAAAATSETMFTNPLAAAGTAPNCLRNLLYANRFRVLAKKTFKIQPTTASWDGVNIEISGNSQNFRIYKKLDLPVLFNSGTTADIANVIDNSIHVVAFANQAGNVLSYNGRIRFVG